MRRIVQVVPLLLSAVVASAACDNGAPWTDDTEPAVEEQRDFGPTAAYGRRLVFMGPGEPLPTAAIFDFTSLSDSVGVRQGVRARLLTEGEWQPLMDSGWRLEPMREPWQIVPGGDLKLMVNDAGDLSAVANRGEPGTRLEPGGLIAETSPDAGTQFVLRQAALRIGEETVRGILLDAQLGRALDPGVVPSASDRPTPIARPGAEGFLVNNSGFYVVFATSGSGAVAWISHGGRDEVQRGATLTPAGWAPASEDTVAMPADWRVTGPGSLSGELSARVTDRIPLTGLDELSALGYILVSGWIGDDNVRRDVFGLIRQVR